MSPFPLFALPALFTALLYIAAQGDPRDGFRREVALTLLTLPGVWLAVIALWPQPLSERVEWGMTTVFFCVLTVCLLPIQYRAGAGVPGLRANSAPVRLRRLAVLAPLALALVVVRSGRVG